MFTATSIIIHAPRERIFEVTANLENWVPMLPHYREIKFFERSADGRKNRVKMACWRGIIPISWHSIHEIKPDSMEVHFTHLRAFTKGMVVVWKYEPLPEAEGGGVRVTITHDLNFRVAALAPLMEPIIAHGFIDPVASKTLATFKKILEAEAGAGSQA
ncbi:MAG: SRPBCC family protein [Verrucomicrobiales bacterium]